METVCTLHPIECSECGSAIGYSKQEQNQFVTVLCDYCTKSEVRVAEKFGVQIECQGEPLTIDKIIRAKWSGDAQNWDHNVRVNLHTAFGGHPYALHDEFPKLIDNDVADKENT